MLQFSKNHSSISVMPGTLVTACACVTASCLLVWFLVVSLSYTRSTLQ